MGLDTRLSRAQAQAVLRTIPNKRAVIAVTTSAVKQDLSAVPLAGGGTVDLRGRWVWLRPELDMVLLRGDHDGTPNPAITTAIGLPLVGGKAEEFWVDDPRDMVDGKAVSFADDGLTVIAAANTNLHILYSDY